MIALLRIVPLALAVILPTLAQADHTHHRLVLQITENDPAQMRSVLDVAANVSRHYSDQGQEVEIQVVAFNAGLHMLREDTSPVKERLAAFRQSMVNVEFKACGNTIDTMAKNEGKEIRLLPEVEVVGTGVAAIMELSEHGWTIVKP